MTEETLIINEQTNTEEPRPTKFCHVCGSEISILAAMCPNCGASTEDFYTGTKKSSSGKVIIAVILGIICAAIVAVIIGFAVNSAQKAKLQDQLLRDWSRIEGENGAYIDCILDFSEDEIEYKIETGYYWLDETIRTYNYRVISGNKIEVEVIDDYWETIEIDFNSDKTMMIMTPALTSIDSSENWFQH